MRRLRPDDMAAVLVVFDEGGKETHRFRACDLAEWRFAFNEGKLQ